MEGIAAEKWSVKVRLHRARALLRQSLYACAGMEREEAFNFMPCGLIKW
jgi:hypothetical protein